jgi:oxygen-independent coproporphyrinogen-3 oxidase
MYGLPNLSNQEWKYHILQVIEMGVTHISAYCLTVEEKTVLNKWVKEAKIHPASENQQSEQFLLLVETLEENGFEQYEISNFCRPGHEAVHNSSYWKGEWYLGVGPSAHSFNGISRSWNIANNQKYMQRIADNEAFFETEILSVRDQYNELLLTGLRTKYGVSLKKLATLHSISESTELKINEFKSAGWMTETNGVLLLTKSGRLKADYITAELFLDVNE